MGSKLAVLAAVIGAARIAAADPAADALKKGIEAYKVGKYSDAIAALSKAYELAPKPETLFALAQAERLDGDCHSAAKHYHKVLEQMSDINVAKLVQQNLSLCEKEPPKAEPAQHEPPGPPPPPEIVTKTVTHDVVHTDPLSVTLVAVGAVGLGAAGGLYVAAQGNREAAATQRTLEDSNRLYDRADSEQKAMYAAGVIGIGLVGYGVYRLASGSSPKADVALVPAPHGGAFWVTARF